MDPRETKKGAVGISGKLGAASTYTAEYQVGKYPKALQVNTQRAAGRRRDHMHWSHRYYGIHSIRLFFCVAGAVCGWCAGGPASPFASLSQRYDYNHSSVTYLFALSFPAGGPVRKSDKVGRIIPPKDANQDQTADRTKQRNACWLTRS